jgi:LemA protein
MKIKPWWVVAGVVAAILIIFVLPLIVSYNRLVSRSQAVDAQWAQVQNVYQRRADLIPNLVATVQGAANFEKSTLEDVTNARASVGKVQVNGNLPANAQAFSQFQGAQDSLSSALSRLLVVVENYPQITATQNFRDLQAQLEGTENRIAVERMRFNTVAQDYNTHRQKFPTSITAGLFGFGAKSYFQATPGAQTPPVVQFPGSTTPSPSAT